MLSAQGALAGAGQWHKQEQDGQHQLGFPVLGFLTQEGSL